MSGYLVEDNRKVTTHRLKEMKAEGKKLPCLHRMTILRLK